MRIILAITIASFLLLSACSDDGNSSDSEYTTTDGVLIGRDFRKCFCCGGWFVEMQTDTMRIWNMPSGFADKPENKDLPVDVRFGWKDMEEGCGEEMDDLILINFIELR